MGKNQGVGKTREENRTGKTIQTLRGEIEGEIPWFGVRCTHGHLDRGTAVSHQITLRGRTACSGKDGAAQGGGAGAWMNLQNGKTVSS